MERREDELTRPAGTTEHDGDVVAVAVGGIMLWRLFPCRRHGHHPAEDRRDDDDDSRA